MNYRLYNYKSGDHYSDHPNLDGAQLSALFHVENGAQVKWTGGPRVWFGHVGREKQPSLGIDREDKPKKRKRQS